MTLDERVQRDLWLHHRKLRDEGRLLSENQLSAYYQSFRRRFAPDRLEKLEGEALAEALHNHSNHESLAYWLEFKSDDEFDTTKLGSIRGGSALKFGVYRGSQNGPWMGKGPGGKPAEISPDQAIEVAERHRAQLLRGCELLDALPQKATDAAYEKLQARLSDTRREIANNVCTVIEWWDLEGDRDYIRSRMSKKDQKKYEDVTGQGEIPIDGAWLDALPLPDKFILDIRDAIEKDFQERGAKGKVRS